MSNRLVYLSGFIAISCVLLTSLYLQYFEGFMPCPLCTLQRFAFAGLGCFFLIGTLLAKKKWVTWLINSLLAFTAILGAVLAGRQIWLQHFPTTASNECGVSLNYMLQVLPLNEVAKKVISGSADCVTRGWQFLSFDMAEWGFLCFIAFFFLAIYLFRKEN